MNIGNKIKELRRARHITQDELAEALGISFQAVSKWECGISMPDITLAPSIAAYFGVTLDDLFDYKLEAVEAEVRRIVDEAYIYRETDIEKGRRIIKDGLDRFPDNDVLLNNLLYLMNYTADPDATVKLASKLIAITHLPDVKYDAYRFLAYAYHAKGDLDAAANAIEQIPEIYFTKLTEVAYLFRDKRGFDAAEKQKHISFENLLQMICKTAEYYETIGEYDKAVRETQRALDFVTVMDHGAYTSYGEFFQRRLAELQTK